MHMQRRGFVRSLAATLVFSAASLAFSAGAVAQSVGKDYTLIEPAQPTDTPAKIEVLEFFSYGCPHCNEFSGLVSAWAAKLPGDVVFKKVPVSFKRPAWANVGRLYYALEVTGDVNRLDAEVFKAIHNDRVSLFDERTMKEWVAKKGVDPKKFDDAFASFGVMSKMKRAEAMTDSYKIQGVPAITIDGKYLVGGKDFNDTLAIADKLIAKARAEKAGRK